MISKPVLKSEHSTGSVVHTVKDSDYKSVRNASTWSTIALCTLPWGLRRPPHTTYRTCQRVRRVGTVDVGDVVDSVLWGGRGDNDDNCDRRGFLKVSIDDFEAGCLGNVLPVGQDSDQGQKA
jgi:hypothetical protein